MTGSMIVLISGPIAVGKTTVASELATAPGSRLIRVREAIETVTGLAGADRATLQRGGADLDRRTNGTWLVDFIEEQIESNELVVVDAMRTIRQTQPVLDHFVDSRLIYLSATESTRRLRYELGARVDAIKASVPFDQAMAHPTEAAVRSIAALADLVIETDDLEASVVADLAAQFYG